MCKIRAALLAALLVPVSGTLSAAIYKSIDENGNVVFTDAPSVDTQPVELSPASTYAPPAPVSSPTVSDEPVKEPAPAIYTSMKIIEPQAEATIRENSGTVDVRVAIEPDLIDAAGHRVQFFLDGQPVGEPSTELATSLANVDRGEHLLHAAVTDFTGKELMRSDGVRFYLQRVSILLKPKKPAP